MKAILLISSNGLLVRGLRWKLEDMRFVVLLSPSLEQAFLEVTPVIPSLVIVDTNATTEEVWQTRKILQWFHNRSPLLLLSESSCEGLEEVYDLCLPKTASMESVLSYIRELVPKRQR